MDAGKFEFDEDTARRMCAAWRIDNSAVPYPSALTTAYASGDALAMNTLELMEISYRLPYGLAYEESQRDKYLNFVRMVAAAGVNFAGATVADIGCGYGGLLKIVKEFDPSVNLVGVECSSSAISYIEKHRPFIRGVVGDITGPSDRLRAAVGAADIVLCTEVLEHVLTPEVALKNLLAIKPKRAIAITVPNGRVDTASQHINFWSPESWRAFVLALKDTFDATIGTCESADSPGGFDNLAILKAK
jgi:2-polyprenyl-3-methyl-5-hydroxy-6-metoxy-1,4-benzoquinol methylase